MKLVIDFQRCQGHTLCKIAAPELIELDDKDGHAVPSSGELQGAEVDAAYAAIDTCPEQALSLDSGAQGS